MPFLNVQLKNLARFNRFCGAGIRALHTPFVNTDGKLFSKVLVANRGEISIRIQKTCKRLGIKTVAVYSEADQDSQFVKYADEAVCIGPPPSQQSYLNIDAIVDACKATGAEAVNPGYGFLSEKADFAEALEKNGLNFIGPSVNSLKLMGDKIESKRCAQQAGVSIVPGYDGNVADDEAAIRIANQIGYPVMIKAAAGGGGKGIRVAHNDQQTRDGFRLSKAEAMSSFNDDRILIERFIQDPKHVEFQILGDKHGNVVHLFERECSVQRRNQKLLEEAPSTALTPEVRSIIGNQAVSLAKTAGYYSAGTVEFLVEKSGEFFFLEMNTRLQVEHPVTEAITGVDLVEQMIRIAAGQPLPFTQEHMKINGWAIENRVNSENPYNNLGMPSIGRITRYHEPSYKSKDDYYIDLKGDKVRQQRVRVDSGVTEGSEISMHYDSLIAKLICWGENREEALKLSRESLDKFVIHGVKHNIGLLRDIMDNEDFASGKFTTKYLVEKYPTGSFTGPLKFDQDRVNKTVAASLYFYFARNLLPNVGNKKNDIAGKYYVLLDGQVKDKFKSDLVEESGVVPVQIIGGIEKVSENVLQFKVEIDSVGSFVVRVTQNQDGGNLNKIELFDGEDASKLVSKAVMTQKVTSSLSKEADFENIQMYGVQLKQRVLNETEYEYLKLTPKAETEEHLNDVCSPMQGSLISVNVQVGDKVSVGQELAVVEAMKMQNAILAEKQGVVTKVHFKPGSKVAEGDVLIEVV